MQVDGVWIDNGYLVRKAAEQTGHFLLWHKLVCRVFARLWLSRTLQAMSVRC
jgi:hypothetical protein